MIRCQDHGAGRKTVSPSREPEGDTLRAPRDGDSTRARSTSYTPQPCVVETFCGPHAAHRVHGYVCDLLRVHPYPTHRTEAQAMPRGVALACAALLLLLLAPSTSTAAAVRPDKTPRARAAVVDAGGNHAFEPTVAVGDLEHVQPPRKLQRPGQGKEHRKPNPVRRRVAAEPAHGHMVGTYAHGKARRAAGGSTHARPSRKTPATTGWLHAAAEYLGLGTTADAVGSIGRGMVPPHTAEALREWPQAIRGIRALARAVWVTDDAAYAAAVAADRDIGTAPSSRWDAIDAKAPMPDHYRRLYNVGDTPDDVSDAPRRLEGNCGVGKPATTQVTVYRCDGVEVCVCVAVAVAVAVAVWLWLWLWPAWLLAWMVDVTTMCVHCCSSQVTQAQYTAILAAQAFANATANGATNVTFGNTTIPIIPPQINVSNATCTEEQEYVATCACPYDYTGDACQTKVVTCVVGAHNLYGVRLTPVCVRVRGFGCGGGYVGGCVGVCVCTAYVLPQLPLTCAPQLEDAGYQECARNNAAAWGASQFLLQYSSRHDGMPPCLTLTDVTRLEFSVECGFPYLPVPVCNGTNITSDRTDDPDNEPPFYGLENCVEETFTCVWLCTRQRPSSAVTLHGAAMCRYWVPPEATDRRFAISAAPPQATTLFFRPINWDLLSDTAGELQVRCS